MGASNIRITTKVAVHALLGDTPTLVEYGSAIMHNLGTREVKAAVRMLRLKIDCRAQAKIYRYLLPI